MNENENRRQRRPRPQIEPRALSRTEAATYCGVSPNTIDALVEKGLLRPLQFADVRRFLFDRRALDVLIDQAVTASATVPTTVPTSTSKYGFQTIARGGKLRASD